MEKFYFNKLIQKFINLKNKFQKIDCTYSDGLMEINKKNLN